MVTSQNEKAIFEGCVDLLQMLMNRFEEYLDYIGFEPDSAEERFCTQFYNTEIVERLFLWKTYHSGGTSQREKCRELGIKDNGKVIFQDKRNTDD